MKNQKSIQDFVLISLLFTIYIEGLNKSLKQISSTSLLDVAKKLNHDLKKISQSLKPTNCPSMLVKQNSSFSDQRQEDNIKFKVDGQRLIPNDSVKYLGVIPDKHPHWTNKSKSKPNSSRQ